uniref:Uncharacterized protein n=1 Tax=Knipowitschia caucasica TaxID=637954 RepID=A0AAV2MRV9_KNICA
MRRRPKTHLPLLRISFLSRQHTLYYSRILKREQNVKRNEGHSPPEQVHRRMRLCVRPAGAADGAFAITPRPINSLAVRLVLITNPAEGC